jgi:hypothetical protein
MLNRDAGLDTMRTRVAASGSANQAIEGVMFLRYQR